MVFWRRKICAMSEVWSEESNLLLSNFDDRVEYGE